jgi:transposase
VSGRKKKMPRSKPAYPAALREELLGRVRAGETPEELAKRYEPSAQTIRNWVRAEEKRQTKSPESGRSVADLERENRELRSQLKEERESVEILKKAAAWFASENRTPPRRSGS